jgi:hypothetical protein
MQFDFTFEDDEVPRDLPDEASVRFWDDEPGHASSARTRIRWQTPSGRDESEVLRRRVDGPDLMALVEAMAWSSESESDELTLGELSLRWW